MTHKVRRNLALIAAFTLGLSPILPARAQPQAQLSVLSYNVEGLPWPARRNRGVDLARIGEELRQLRAAGRQPHVVLFEEAFSRDARAIAAKAGYRYVADGPRASDPVAVPASAADRAFRAAARFLSGETWGKWRGSGLRIASDYPILGVKRMTYPICAGTDCLANKGAMLVTIAVPGVAEPVAIVDTHLNSRLASGVSFDRSFYAYRRQVDALSDFVRANVPADMPLIVAGDFNAGQEARRRDYLLRKASGWRSEIPAQAALQTCLAQGDQCPTADRADLAFSEKRGRDYQWFAPSGSADIALASMTALFGHDGKGRMLSDHVGYAATYLIRDKRPLAFADAMQVRPAGGSAAR